MRSIWSGFDIVMVFDECTPYPCYVREEEVDGAQRALVRRSKRRTRECESVFGIVQAECTSAARRVSTRSRESARWQRDRRALVGEPSRVCRILLNTAPVCRPEAPLPEGFVSA